MLLMAQATALCAQGRALQPFPQQDVALLAGTPYKVAETRSVNYCNFYDPDRLLYIFRKNHGLSVSGMSGVGAWEAPNCLLRGHMMGHILSASAMAYAASGNTSLKSKVQYMLRVLDTCQKRAVTAGFSAGYLGGLPESRFDVLQNGGTYCGEESNPDCVWAPWYTQHKIFAGLLDCYTCLGDTLALTIAKGMADWAYTRLGKVSASTLQSMWTRYIAGEYGGYNESAAELYMITQTANYRSLGALFDETTSGVSLGKLAANTDGLNSQHANQLIPRIVGYLRMYDATGTANYLNAAVNFWNMVVLHHTFRISPLNTGEMFRAADQETAHISTDRVCENCAGYNISKLSKDLFLHDPQAKYMDYWERVNINHLLSNANVAGASASARVPYACYMTDVMCGADKNHEYNTNDYNDYTCCNGTGLEQHLMYNKAIYASRGDTLYVNQFIASRLNWTERNVMVKMETRYPESDTITLTITPTGAVNMPVKVRAPWWVRRSVEIYVDGVQKHMGAIHPSSYFTLRQTVFSAPTVITLVVPQTLRFERSMDDANIGSVFYGANCIVEVTSSSSYLTLAANTVTKNESSLQFTGTAGSSVSMLPFYKIAANRYSTYTKISGMPLTWQDTIMDTQDDWVAGVVQNGLSGVPAIAGLMLRMNSSRITLTFNAPFATGNHLLLDLFNAAGVRVASLPGKGNTGERQVSFILSGQALPPGLYCADLKIGAERYLARLLCQQ
jgi:DUF1680 family protein